ncbi:MAG: MarR family transcriptional regulator [Dermatophilaceae bacterium]
MSRRKSASAGHHSDDDGPALDARAPDPTASDPTASARTALELNSAAIHLLRAIQVVDRESGVAPARLSALSVLVFGGPRTLTALARAEQVAPPTMSRVVDALCDLGLVTRRPHPDHGRMVVVEATDAGREVMERARLRRAEVIGLGLTALDPAARDRITAAAPDLIQLAAAVRQHLATPPPASAGPGGSPEP